MKEGCLYEPGEELCTFLTTLASRINDQIRSSVKIFRNRSIIEDTEFIKQIFCICSIFLKKQILIENTAKFTPINVSFFIFLRKTS